MRLPDHLTEGPVKIRNEDGIGRKAPHGPQQVQGGRLDSSARTSGTANDGGDRVELSDKARALLVASDAIVKLPQIRADKVESLKQSIEDGSYHVPGEKIAERILGEGVFA
jgi:negative regulator of flagellin synthesis FlgM